MKLTKIQEKKLKEIEQEKRIREIRNYLWGINNERLYLQAESEWLEKHKKWWDRLDNRGFKGEEEIKLRQLLLFEQLFIEKTGGIIF